MEDSLFDNRVGVAVKLVEGALCDVLADARPNDGARVTNKVRDGENLPNTFLVVLVHNELVVVRDAEVEHGVIACLHFNLVSDEVWAEHQDQSSQSIWSLGLSR